jgi:hypothetical protein
VLLRSGMTAQGWFNDDGRQVETADIGAVDGDGRPLPLVASTLDVGQPLVDASPRDVLELAPTAVYMLDPAAADAALLQSLDAGRLFRFAFNYRPDHRSEVGFLLKNDAGVFAVVGTPAPATWAEPAAAPPIDAGNDDDDDLDFEMF